MWVKLDDGFYDNPKMRKAGLAGAGLFCYALAYSARHMRDGFVPDTFIARNVRTARRLQACGVFVRVEGGYQIHDFLKYNPPASEILARREKARVRMNKLRSSRSVREPRPVPTRTDPNRKKEQEQTQSITYAVNGQKRPLPAVVFRSPEGFVVPDDLVTRWGASYPAIDVRHEISAAFEWSVANPKNVKSNWPRFLVNWFKRAQDKAPPKGESPVQERELSPELKRIWGET